MALNGVIDKPGDVDQFVFKARRARSTTSTATPAGSARRSIR